MVSTTDQRPLYAAHDPLRAFCARVFEKYGMLADDAATVADNLVAADLRGVPSHGVNRMPIYTKRLDLGLFNPRATPGVERTGPSVAVVDGDNGMGAVVGLKAMDTACTLAAETGVGAVTVRNSNHYGTAAYYLERPVRRGFIGITCTNASPAVAPFGGCDPLLGTNPLGVGVPAGPYPPIIADLATSIVAKAKIIMAHQRGEDIPPGLALDAEGRPTTDSQAALGGALLPFGGHKGSAIAILVEILAAALSGARMMTEIPDFNLNLTAPSGYGHFFLALDIRRFMEPARFEERVAFIVGLLKASRLAEGAEEILMPGELEHRREIDRRRHGVPLSPFTVEGLRTLARTWGIDPPELGDAPLA